MRDVNIHTTLNVRSAIANRQIYTGLRKGQTASFIYALPVDESELAQLTFTFGQNGNIFYYKAVNYFVETKDEMMLEGKKYYDELIPANSIRPNECQAKLTADIEFQPGKKYYEIEEEPLDEYGLPWSYDDHFYVDRENNIFTLFLDSSETSQFEVTEDYESFVDFEITLRVNTSNDSTVAYKDTTIIAPQQQFVILDSLFSKIGNVKKSYSPIIRNLVVSDSLVCSDKIVCRN